MSVIDRREFLRASTATALGFGLPGELYAQVRTDPPAAGQWDSGAVRHLIPTVSDTRMLIKASFNAALDGAPSLRIGDTSVRGRMGDKAGQHRHINLNELQNARR